MRSWLTHNLGLKVFSVALAAIIWLVIQARSTVSNASAAHPIDHFQLRILP